MDGRGRNTIAIFEIKKLTLKDTALGRLREQNERELKASFQAKSPEEQAAMIEELKRMHEGGGIVDEAAV